MKYPITQKRFRRVNHRKGLKPAYGEVSRCSSCKELFLFTELDKNKLCPKQKCQDVGKFY